MYVQTGRFIGVHTDLIGRAEAFTKGTYGRTFTRNPTRYATVSGPEVIDAFKGIVPIPGTWRLGMLVEIFPDGYIPIHYDNPAAENDIHVPLARFHLVITTNPYCLNFHGTDWQRLEEGGIYTMTPYDVHGSVNLGDTSRLHLVIDSQLTDA